jgi:CheY-like chemotaxis protein
VKALIAEDNRAERNILCQIFEKVLGFSVLEAENGKQGLARAEACDLIVTDLMMPVMGGLEFIQRLRDREETAQVPILAVSGENGLQQAALDAGACAFLDKPVRLAQLKDTVNKLVAPPRE